MKSIFEIGRSFNAHAVEYEREADVQVEIGQRLIARLEYLKISPRSILDVGCGPGVFFDALRQRYPEANVVGIDLAHTMLTIAKTKQRLAGSYDLLNVDMHQMPFCNGQFDLIFSNQVLHWSYSLQAAFREWQRVLSPGGCLLFSTLGPDTFQELKQAFQQVDSYAHVNTFYDMHDVGDAMLAAGFEDPVMDRELLAAHYSSLPRLLQSLKAQGVKNVHPQRQQGLTSKSSWRAFEHHMESTQTETGKYPLTYEVVYGHAWKPRHAQAEDGSAAMISVAQLKASLPSKQGR